MKAFLSHAAADQRFVLQVASHLRRYFADVFTFEERQRSDESWVATESAALRESEVLIVFLGATFSNGQRRETEEWVRLEHRYAKEKNCVLVAINGQLQIQELRPDEPNSLQGRPFLPDKYTCPLRIVECAHDIIKKLSHPRLSWRGFDGLPFNPHLFDYEKRIIDFFVTKDGLHLNQPEPNEETNKVIEDVRAKLRDGCPDNWPSVQSIANPNEMRDNNLPRDIRGEDRDPDSFVVAAALTRLNAARHNLVFREAGPRAKLFFPRRPNQELNVGIVVLGGIAPGINTVIDAIVHRHWLYQEHQKHNLKVFGLHNGLWALENFIERTSLLRPDTSSRFPHPAPGLKTLETSEYATEGGSMLGTWRDSRLTDINTREKELRNVASRLAIHNIDILYVIGGDGSMKAAHALYNVARATALEEGKQIMSVVAVPKTMDNDILWMWQSFGFSSAVQKAREIVQQLHTEVKSNPRLCVLQLYGSDSGFVVSHTVLASATGHCDLALIPEQPFNMIDIALHLKARIQKSHRPVPFGLVVMAETAIPDDALACLGDEEPQTYVEAYKEVRSKLKLTEDEKNAVRMFIDRRKSKKRIEGQTDDTLRRASLHLVADTLEILLKRKDIGHSYHDVGTDWDRLRLLKNEPRHLLRATAPSTSDITMAQRLGILAVDNALAGYTDFMISQWLTEYVMVPLELVALGRKRIPQDGIFWKSVIAKTGQSHISLAPL